MKTDKLAQSHIAEIDLLKGLCIFTVIFIHTVPRSLMYDGLFPFHLWQAVPIFIILLGFNAARSAERKGLGTLFDFYNKAYFRKYFSRFIVPVFVTFAMSLLMAFWLGKTPYFGSFTLLAKFPMTGPGNYYVGIVLQFILVFPLVFVFFKKHPVMMILTCFALDIVFQLLSDNKFMMDTYYYLYTSNLLRYLSALALGIWISQKVDLWNKRNAFIVVGFVMSFLYILLQDYTSWELAVFPPRWRTQTVLSFFYPLVLVILTIKFYPAFLKGPLFKFICLLGRASLHIFLVQILYFGIGHPFMKWDEVSLGMLYALAVNLTICFGIGLLFYFTEGAIKRKLAIRRAPVQVNA